MGIQRKIHKPKKEVAQPAALADTGIMFESKFRVFILVPVQGGTTPDVAVSKFRWEMQRLRTRANRPSLYDLHKASLKIKENMENNNAAL